MKIFRSDHPARTGLYIFLLAISIPPLVAGEKQTSYRFQNIDFQSLSAAEAFMRQNSYYGGVPDPSANWLQFLKRQEVPPGAGDPYLEFGFRNTDYTEAPGVVAYMTPNTAVECNVNCPILDGFGNDFCTANIWPFCLSDGPIIDKILELESRASCPAEVQTYPSYAPVLDNLGGFQTVWQFSNQNPVQASGFSQYKGDLVYTSYQAGCGYPQTQVQSIYPHSSVYCPAGYNLLVRTDTGHQCANPLMTRIYETGAVTPEPSMDCGVENPCHPTTGNKSLVENDFSSPTLSFARSYHSMTHYDDYAGLGRGWTHNFAQRILDYPGPGVSARKMIDGRGNVEHFICADSPICSVYRSVSRAGKILMPISGGWLYRDPNGEQRTFDAEGKLESIELMNGNYVLLNIAYGGNGKVSAVADQFGRQLSFHYNQDGLLAQLELPSGDSITFAYSDPNPPAGAPVERQNLVKVVREDLTERIYHYEDRNSDASPRNVFLLTGITDELGERFATYAYDDRARVILSEHAGGADLVTLNYTHRPGESFNWSVTEVTGPLGEVATYDMDEGPFRKIRSVADSRGMLAVRYDPVYAWRSSKTDREFNETTYEYDGLHETRRTEAAGTADERVTETLWNREFNRVSELREPGKTTQYLYNNRGQLVTRTKTDTATRFTRSWRYTYFEAPSPGPLIGQVKSMDGPRTDVSDITNYEYYTHDDVYGHYLTGDLKAVVNPLGHRTDYLQYDANGRPLKIRDANGVETSFSYHDRGWLGSQTVDGMTTYFSYDAAGNLTRITQPEGSAIRFEYDGAHRLNAIEDQLGNRIEYELDANGNRTAEEFYNETGDLRRQLSRVYDQFNRLTMLLDGNNDETRYGYDSKGNVIESTDANSSTRVFEYDGLGRLARVIDGVLGESVVDYDARNNMLGVTDPMGNATHYAYDGLDNLTGLDSPDTGVSSYEYDAAGNRVVAVDARGVRTKFTYDALNRLTDITYADSDLDVSFTHDLGNNGKGRLSRMTDAGGITDYTYDARGNLVRELRTVGAAQYLTVYVYDAADRVLEIVYPSGMIIDYTLDPAGRIQKLEQTLGAESRILISEIRYEPFGPENSFRYGNGVTYDATFDRDYELFQLHSGNELNWLINHDPAGNIIAIEDGRGAQFDHVFAFDELHRLRSATGNYGSEIFDYDANGNRTHYRSDLSDQVYAYVPQSNRLSMQDHWSINRDASGNRTEMLDASGAGQFYEFAENSRLVRFGLRETDGDRIAGEYVYDGRGRRFSKTANGVTTVFVYSQAGELLGEYTDNGEPVAEYIYLNGKPVAVFTSLTEPPAPVPVTVTIDNDEPGTASTGTWKKKTGEEAFGNDYRLGNKADTYRWTPAPITGTYEVYAWRVSGMNYSRLTTYTISHAGVSDEVVVGRSENQTEWRLLGTFAFSGSGSEYIELHSGDGKKIIADAIRLVPVSDVDAGPATAWSTYFIHTDHLGTPRQVSDDQQTTVWRWDSPPFGNSAPDEDPDGDGSMLTLNLRFPGQYYDSESGLHYNFFRTYDPGTGRFIESDPIGLGGGLNSFSYAANNPNTLEDRYGLIVTGDWIRSPKWNIADYGLTGAEFIAPYLDEWGFLKVLRVYGYASGYVNIDVRCSDTDACESGDWEIHKSIGLSYNGYKDLGPNAVASGVGSAAGPLAGVVTGIFTVGGSALSSLLDFLGELQARGGEKVRWLYELGPLAICQGSKQ